LKVTVAIHRLIVHTMTMLIIMIMTRVVSIHCLSQAGEFRQAEREFNQVSDALSEWQSYDAFSSLYRMAQEHLEACRQHLLGTPVLRVDI